MKNINLNKLEKALADILDVVHPDRPTTPTVNRNGLGGCCATSNYAPYKIICVQTTEDLCSSTDEWHSNTWLGVGNFCTKELCDPNGACCVENRGVYECKGVMKELACDKLSETSLWVQGKICWNNPCPLIVVP